MRAYPVRPVVGVGVCVLRGDAVLLVRRLRAPGVGAWSLPGGAQELGETAEAAARRELMEETGVTVGLLRVAAVVDAIHRDGAGAVEWHYTIVDYAGWFAGGEARAGSDAGEVAWVEVGGLAGLGVSEAVVGVVTAARGVLEG